MLLLFSSRGRRVPLIRLELEVSGGGGARLRNRLDDVFGDTLRSEPAVQIDVASVLIAEEKIGLVTKKISLGVLDGLGNQVQGTTVALPFAA